ncbi:MAG: sugar-binding transcriptional regulator [Anaerolineaceae bacterium]|jgi:DNA-binding transcriptional regulator LsrR (DeoR family)
MKQDKNEVEKMVIVAHDYYEKNMDQIQIAKELGLSRPTVSRLLKRALAEKIVKIEVIDPYRSNPDLAKSLCTHLGLTNVSVISGQSPSDEIIRRNIAYAAADYLQGIILPGDIVGIGWGRTMKELASYIKPTDTKDVLFIPLMGGVGQVDASFQSSSVLETISSSFGAKWIQFHVPAMVENKKLKAGLLELPDVKQVVQYWGRMTKAVVGIGVPPFEHQFLFYDYIGEMEKLQLSKRGAAGDICMRFFDINGEPIQYVKQDCMNVDFELLKQVKTVIAVAGGKQKIQAIIGASRGKYINHLVTDEYTALHILEYLHV